MAKIKYSALVSEMRNKLNGSVLSKNRYGSYVRNKITPINPQTSYQLAQRANLSLLSQAWGSLTEEQRLAWIAKAKEKAFTDIFGDTKYLTGQALFVSANLNLLSVGEPILELPGISLATEPILITDLTLVRSATTGLLTTASIELSPAALPAGFALVVYATPGYSPGITFVKNKFRRVDYTGYASGVVNFLAGFNARFGGLNLSDKVSVKVAFMDLSTGELGVPYGFTAFVTS